VGDETKKEQKKRAAVIIGISKHHHNKFDLNGCTNDATELYNKLLNSEVYQYDIPPSRYLIDDQACADDIRKAISAVFYKPDKYELVLFYFSGHGVRDSYGNGWLIAHDTDPSDIFATGIDMSALRRAIDQCKNKEHVLVILDCCNSGVATEGSQDVLIRNDPGVVRDIDAELNRWSTKENRIILSSSKADQKSKEEEFNCKNTKDEPAKHFHGIFSYYLIEGLDHESVIDNGWEVSLKKLMNYVYVNIAKRKGSDQVPKCYRSGTNLSEFTSFPELKITTSNRYSKDRNNTIKSAWEILNDPPGRIKYAELSRIAQDIEKILEYQPDYADALDIKKTIVEKALVECRRTMMVWFQLNNTIIQDGIKKELELRDCTLPRKDRHLSLYNYLFEVMPQLSFDDLLELNKFEAEVFVHLSNIAASAQADNKENPGSVKTFIEWVKMAALAYNPKTQQLTIPASSARKGV
jgi:Caspase domain